MKVQAVDNFFSIVVSKMNILVDDIAGGNMNIMSTRCVLNVWLSF